jgi:hypothetical protein
MADDLGKRGQEDRERINLNEDFEVLYWTKRFGVSRDQLKAAVAKAGPMVTDVRAELGK